jgi:hypothetical protein
MRTENLIDSKGKKREARFAHARALGSARVPRAGFGVAPKQSLPRMWLQTRRRRKGKFAIAGRARQTRETRALPRSPRSQRDHFPKHPQAVFEKAHFASFSMIPPDRNFPNMQSGAVRKKKQFDVDRKAVDPC